MKKGIHPTYYPNANVRCVCGQTWTVGSTASELEVEICSRCHPFYSGKEKILDTSGRVDKFKRRAAKSQKTIRAKGVKKQRTKKPRINNF